MSAKPAPIPLADRIVTHFEKQPAGTRLRSGPLSAALREDTAAVITVCHKLAATGRLTEAKVMVENPAKGERKEQWEFWLGSGKADTFQPLKQAFAGQPLVPRAPQLTPIKEFAVSPPKPSTPVPSPAPPTAAPSKPLEKPEGWTPKRRESASLAIEVDGECDLQIDDKAIVKITSADGDRIMLTPEGTRKLGDFLAATTELWS